MATRQSKPGAIKSSATDHQELEWQFDVDDLEPVEGWLGQHSSGSGVVPEDTVEITDTYYDTDDWRFYRAGYALRVRKTNGGVEATMKSLSPAEGGLRRRREISEPLKDDRPATLRKARGPVGKRLKVLLGGREISPLFQVQTRRKRFALLLKSSNDGDLEDVRIGEVALDSSEFGDEPERLKRVEVEAVGGTSPDLHGFVDEMQFAL
ncbi:MAG TPA: CYTH domain-containing protein, partial [Rubrobacter sp.]|nr:CYTH domain-containing protein [Rubrobacter sp.]